MTGSPFLVVAEVAALLRVKIRTVYEWTRAAGPDAIPCYRAGHSLVFDRDEVLAWFKATQRREGCQLSPSRRPRGSGRVLAAGCQRAPDARSEGQPLAHAGGAQVSEGNGAGGAIVVPSEGGTDDTGGLIGSSIRSAGSGEARRLGEYKRGTEAKVTGRRRASRRE